MAAIRVALVFKCSCMCGEEQTTVVRWSDVVDRGCGVQIMGVDRGGLPV